MKIVRRLQLVVLLASLAAMVLVLRPSTSQAAADPGHMTMRQWFQMMDARYPDPPYGERKEEEGTGFEPYQRFKWFMQRRLGDQEDLEPGARWKAWEEMRRIEQTDGTSSPTWYSLGPINVTGRCLAIKIDPTNANIAYAGFASGGIWKSIDGGTTWTPLGDYLPTLSVGAIRIDPTNPSRIWIGTGEGWGNIDAIHGVGMLVSTDAGLTWNTTGFSYDMSSGRDVFEIEYNPATGTLMVAADNGLWRSTDQGVTFTRLLTGSWRDVELQRGSTTNMFACAGDGSTTGFFRSFDDGATWTQTTTGTPTSIYNNRFALCAADPNLIYWGIANSDGTMKGIWKSTDAGASFSQIYSGNHYGTQGWYDLTISVDPTNGNNVFSGGVNYFHSTNGGTSFVQYAGNVHVDHHATAWAPSDPTQFWVGSDGGVWKSTNSGGSFADRNAALTTLQFYAINQSETLPTRALGGTQDNGTWLYNNSLNWSYVLGGDGFFTEADRSNPDVLYGELYYGDHHRSTNGGSSFTSINNGINQQGPWSTPTWMDYSDPNILWTAHTTRMYTTTNRGTNWTAVGGLTFNSGGVNIHQCKSNPNVMAMVTGSVIFMSTDHGVTWSNRPSGSGLFLSDVAIDPNDPNTIVVTRASYLTSIHKVTKSTDGGVTWTAIDAGLPDIPANTIEIDPMHSNWYFLGTDLGVWVSFDAGLNWVPFDTGLPHVVISDLRIHDTARIIRAGSYGRGMWECDLSGLDASAGVPAQHPTVQPITLRVFGNPSTQTATLRYGMRAAGSLRIGLYDAEGRLVRNLIDRFAYPIMGSVDVDVKDLPAGVYFARMEANGATASEKVIVEK